MDNFSLVPVDYQPEFENVSLVPVAYDPFAGDAATQQAQSPQAQAQQAQTQPAQSQQAQTQQPTMGASQSSAPTPGVATTDSTGSALTAGASDFFRSIPRGIVSGFNSAASALGRATQAEMGQDVDAPTPEQGMKILERDVTGPMHRPEGRAGQFGASVGEFLGNPPSYLVPGSLPLKVGTAVLGGLGSEAGGQLGEGTPWEGPLRFAGGSLGVLGPLSAARLGTGVRAAGGSTAADGLAGSTISGTGRAAAGSAARQAISGAEATLPEGITRTDFGRLAGFEQGLEASRKASTEATAEIISNLKSAGITARSVAAFQKIYEGVARDNPSNLSAVHRAALLANILRNFQ